VLIEARAYHRNDLRCLLLMQTNGRKHLSTCTSLARQSCILAPHLLRALDLSCNAHCRFAEIEGVGEQLDILFHRPPIPCQHLNPGQTLRLRHDLPLASNWLPSHPGSDRMQHWQPTHTSPWKATMMKHAVAYPHEPLCNGAEHLPFCTELACADSGLVGRRHRINAAAVDVASSALLHSCRGSGELCSSLKPIQDDDKGCVAGVASPATVRILNSTMLGGSFACTCAHPVQTGRLWSEFVRSVHLVGHLQVRQDSSASAAIGRVAHEFARGPHQTSRWDLR
jgi:hypothetical protein